MALFWWLCSGRSEARDGVLVRCGERPDDALRSPEIGRLEGTARQCRLEPSAR